ncbi:hypothetical protein HanHA300_Chr03g0084831 [Helianthus annuus]|nr:hypothetical protein HanHA300_Chr03g0084831 [Helianthus annuus]KAJ0607398.1 hypothetical protein HanHA89_Chr03g0096341 [Helianthus annuus]KAJ0767454.1 hypothetical protein HanLR1_Chr03g0089611 [Helianthus annuus]KAJ0773288.1 hypothetical protein HanOQP8_Chr03g0097561 [Helianthus annuus]
MAEERCCRSRRRQWKQAAVSAVVSVSDQWVVSRSSGLCHGPAVLVLIRWVSPIFRWFVSLSDEFSRSELSGLRVKSRVQSTQFSLDKVRFGQICPRQKRFGLTRLTQRVDSVNSTESTRSTAASQLSRFGSAGLGQAAWSDGSVWLTRSNRANSVNTVKASQLG